MLYQLSYVGVLDNDARTIEEYSTSCLPAGVPEHVGGSYDRRTGSLILITGAFFRVKDRSRSANSRAKRDYWQ